MAAPVSDTDNARRRHDFLQAFAEQATKRAIEAGMAEEQAIAFGLDLADWIADLYGGQHIYFVKDEASRLSKRDRQICAEMEFGKASDIAAKYGISYVRVHQIHRRYLAELRARAQEAQHDMFHAPVSASLKHLSHDA